MSVNSCSSEDNTAGRPLPGIGYAAEPNAPAGTVHYSTAGDLGGGAVYADVSTSSAVAGGADYTSVLTTAGGGGADYNSILTTAGGGGADYNSVLTTAGGGGADYNSGLTTAGGGGGDYNSVLTMAGDGNTNSGTTNAAEYSDLNTRVSHVAAWLAWGVCVCGMHALCPT